ncbi:MAG: ribbon-helix-helix domain-containing protein, partial [Nitrospiria bacterium]
MPQINIHVNDEFEAALKALMKARGLKSKSETIRVAVREAATRSSPTTHDWGALLGLIDRVPGPKRTRKTSTKLLA